MTPSFFPSRPNTRVRLRARRRGVSLWLFVVTFPLVFGVAGLVIDMGQLYAKRAQAQRAADAAALAGAMVSGKNNANVEPKALYYADRNGFSAARGDEVSVVANYESAAARGAANINTVRVGISHQERVFFAPVCEALLSFFGWSSGAAVFSRQVSARAVARKFVYLPMSMGGVYGIGSASFIANSINGPQAVYHQGDAWATKYLGDGSPNPRYAETGGVSKYTIKVTDQYLKNSSDGKVYVQLFDPDCRNTTSAGEYDVYLRPNTNITAEPITQNWLTTTQYEIWKDGRPIPGATATYGGTGAADLEANQKWVTPAGFGIDLRQYGTGDYQIRVKSLDGSSANAYHMRAGPLEGLTMDDTTWNQTYGDKGGTNAGNIAVPMSADGRLQICFTGSGTAKLNLGYVGPEFAGRTVQVSHYDLDIGSQSLSYSCDTLPGQTFPGVIPPNPNGKWSTDGITLPADFKGGNLSVNYLAGQNDVSSWELFGEGDGDGFVRLIE